MNYKPVVRPLASAARIHNSCCEFGDGTGRTDGLPFFTSILKKLVNA
jgi:hypothetical protein